MGDPFELGRELELASRKKAAPMSSGVIR